MKKFIFAKMMMLAMMAAMCVTFTACGGDSDDDGTPQVPSAAHRVMSRNTCPALTGS